jgi:hypothetical protein
MNNKGKRMIVYVLVVAIIMSMGACLSERTAANAAGDTSELITKPTIVSLS